MSAPDNPPHVWLFALKAAAVLAAAMGLGRFAYTPILPLMESQTALTAQSASLVATANYLGYLVGAVIGMLVPRWGRVRRTLQVSGLLLIASMLLMPRGADRAVARSALRSRSRQRRDLHRGGQRRPDHSGPARPTHRRLGLRRHRCRNRGIRPPCRRRHLCGRLASCVDRLRPCDRGPDFRRLGPRPRGGTAAKRRARPAERRRRRLLTTY